MSRQRGFSLVELLIVVAIFLTIAAIAVPNMLKSRLAANEASAVGSTRLVVTAEFNYYQTFGGGTDYAQTLNALGPGNGNLLDATVASGSKSGYSISLTASQLSGTNFNQFLVSTIPQNVGYSGNRSFCAIEDGVVKYDTTGSAFASHGACASSVNVIQ